MNTVKIKLSTISNKETRYKRNIAPREAFVDFNTDTKKICLKYGSYKWKPFDTGISRKEDRSYINSKKELYSGLCFKTKKDAKAFMQAHEEELNEIAKSYPTFGSWVVMCVAKKFAPTQKIVYGKHFF